ncbi:gliding motility-associated C-terminal domain-containing protein [Parafilimonas sp.]|uniref:T9SS type B sorting domain-containing protein n=1 Tax=Parafilimonas sp. TaxID=1969739 RepID=UPI003F80CC65
MLPLIFFCFNAYSNPDSAGNRNLPNIPNQFTTADDLTLSLTAIDPTCEYEDGRITATPSNGTPPYLYSLNGDTYSSQNVWRLLPPGTYTVTVKDADGNTATSTATLTNQFERPVALNSSYTNPSGCTATDGYYTVNVTGGMPPYLYSMDAENYQPNNVFPNLGFMPFPIAYAKDAHGCVTKVESYGVQRCFDFSFGYTVAPANCGEGGYVEMDEEEYLTFSSDGINYHESGEFRNLVPGLFNIYIKAEDGTVIILTTQVYNHCPIDLEVAFINASCGLNNGSIQATGSKGEAPYHYSIDGTNFQTSGLFTNLAPGDYTVTITDETGITATKTVTIGSGCMKAAATVKNATCGNANGAVTITATNGTAPYQYSIDNFNFQKTGVFVNLKVGEYTITVKDATGVTDNTPVVVDNIAGPQVKAVATNAGCNSNDGKISITASGGTSPYTYSLDNLNFQQNNVFTNLPPGVYTSSVTDGNNCSAQSDPLTVYNLCLKFTLTITNATCNALPGAIAVNVTSGNSPYLYSLDGVNFQPDNIFKNVKTGAYTITVKDNTGTVKTQNAEVKESCITLQTTVKNATCKKDNGEISVNASNGASPFSYSLDGLIFQTDSLFTELAAGSYSVTVRDAANASAIIKVNVTAIAPVEASAAATPAGCTNDDGSVTLAATGGSMPYLYSFNNSNYTDEVTYGKLAVNTYMAAVKDADGCIASLNVQVPLNDNLFAEAGGDKLVCEGDNVQLSVSSNGAMFSWSPSTGLDNSHTASPKASPLFTTKYVVTASTAVCTIKDSVVVMVNPAPVADAGRDTAICYGNSVTLNASGGVKYNWMPAQYLSDAHSNTPKVTKPAQTITYHLTVTDDKGCSSRNNETVTVMVAPVAKVFAGNDTSAVINQPIQLAAQDVNHAGFTSYIWMPVTGLSNAFIANPSATLNTNITYTVTASTPAGCEATDIVTVKVYAGPDIYVPSAFTPDKNGLNDMLRPIPVGIKDFLFFKVFDRWGKMIFYTTDYHKGWDGSVKGVVQSLNTYVWMAGGKDGDGKTILRKGTVTLIR